MKSKVFSNIQFFPFNKDDSNLLGFARVTVADSVRLTGIKLAKGKHGPFVDMPQRVVKDQDGEKYVAIFYPLSTEILKDLEKYILEAYEAVASSKTSFKTFFKQASASCWTAWPFSFSHPNISHCKTSLL